MESESCRVDLQAEGVPADQLVVGEAALQVLRDHVDVLEVPLQQVILIGGGRAREVVEAVDDLGCEPDPVRGGQAQVSAMIEGDGVVAAPPPDLGSRFAQESPAAAPAGV